MKYKINTASFVQLLASILSLIAFFLPWVLWAGIPIKGMDMATGEFFRQSEKMFGINSPFPQLNFSFNVFWLIPLLSVINTVLTLRKTPKPLVAFIAGSLSLAIITAFILFSNTLIDLGAGKTLTAMLKPAIYLTIFSAVLLIVTAFPVKHSSWKIFWILVGPVLAFSSFKLVENYVMNETHSQTANVKADYTLTADELIREFLSNDTMANSKYTEKMIIVKGKVAAADILADSSSTLKFADSTGSYAIFSFDKDQVEAIKNIQAGAEITVKGVCSGSIYSEILGNTSISFKRSVLVRP